MISEALELRLEGGRVSHSWCMCVVTHGYSGLGVGRVSDGGWYVCGTKQWWLVEFWEMPEHIPCARERH